MSIGQYVHFSIDGVTESFRWIYENRPESIFDEPMFAKLKRWNETYQLNCDLYVYEETEGFSLKQIQNCYWKEISENGWLRLTWYKRKPGGAEEGTDEEIQSLRRSYALITGKAGKTAWATKVRLPHYTAKGALIEAMEKLDISVFLTDAEGRGYDLSGEESENLCREGIYQKEEREYVTTDICLDTVKGEAEIDEKVNLAKEIISRQRQKLVLEVFFHEWAFQGIFKEAEQFWARMNDAYLPCFAQCKGEKKAAFFPETACIEGDKIYFTELKDSRVFCMDIDGDEPEVYCWLSEVQFNWRNFSGMYCYHGKIVLFPYMETRIVIVDMQTKETRLLALPQGGENVLLRKYRKAVRKEEKVWLVTAGRPMQIIEFDMETEGIAVYDQWPEKVNFNISRYGFQFASLWVDENYLYLLKADCNRDVKMNLATHEITLWDEGDLRPYAVVRNEKIYSVPFFYGAESSYRLMNRDTGKIIREETLETRVYEGPFPYRWFNPVEIEDFIWYAPCKESCLLRIEKKTDELEKVAVTPRDFYYPKHVGHEYIGYELLDAGERLMLIPDGNNCLINIDKKTLQISYRKLYLSYEERVEGILLRKMKEGTMINENTTETLEGFTLGLGRIGGGDGKVLDKGNLIGENIIAKILEAV